MKEWRLLAMVNMRVDIKRLRKTFHKVQHPLVIKKTQQTENKSKYFQSYEGQLQNPTPGSHLTVKD